MTKLPVTINTNSVLFIEADPEAFGRIFAAMNNVDQVAVLRSMEEAMRPHRMQWDYIAIELEKPENRETRDALAQALIPYENAPVDATPDMVKAALAVDWSNEDEEGTAHNIWHAMRAAWLAR